jgi:hypothetical protein
MAGRHAAPDMLRRLVVMVATHATHVVAAGVPAGPACAGGSGGFMPRRQICRDIYADLCRGVIYAAASYMQTYMRIYAAASTAPTRTWRDVRGTSMYPHICLHMHIRMHAHTRRTHARCMRACTGAYATRFSHCGARVRVRVHAQRRYPHSHTRARQVTRRRRPLE